MSVKINDTAVKLYMGRGSTRMVMGGGECFKNWFKALNILNIRTLFCKKLSKSLFSHQMLLIYQRMVLSLKSSLLQKHMLIQLLDSQETNAQLMKTVKLRMQPD